MSDAFCCGMVHGTDKHQLWCSEHPDRKKKATMETHATAKPPSNSEQAVVDDIAKGVVEKLDADHPGWIVDEENNRLKNDEVTLWVGGGPSKVVAWLKGAGKHYSDGGNSNASQDHIWDGFKRWQERRYLANLKAKETPAPVIPVLKSDPRRLAVLAVAAAWIPVALWTGLVWWASRPAGPDGGAPPGLPPMEYGWHVVGTILNLLWFPIGMGAGAAGVIASFAAYYDCIHWPFGKRNG